MTFLSAGTRSFVTTNLSARIVTYQWLGNGKQIAIIYEMTNCEITEPVRVAATGAGSIPITVALKAVPPPGETEGELRVTIVGDDGDVGCGRKSEL